MNELALFAGAGGGILAGCLLGWNTVCAVEIEEYPRRVLLQRQRDGLLPRFPIWDDVCTFDGRPWRGKVDVISGGFPCQDISAAGRGAGINGARSGLWAEMFRIICEVRPEYAFMENSPMLTSRGLGRVLGDMASAGYDAAWCVLGADDMGAPHVRKRIWILAHDSHTNGMQCAEHKRKHKGTAQPSGGGAHFMDARAEVANADNIRTERRQQFPQSSQETRQMADTYMPRCEKQRLGQSARAKHSAAQCGDWWRAEPAVGRMANGVANRVDRIKSLGNGQVPAVAAAAFTILQHKLLTHLNRHDYR